MLQKSAAEYAKAVREQGEEAAMKQFFEGARRLSLLYRKLETNGKPFAIAIHGACLGGAFELALACHYRVLSDSRQDAVGLPEIKVGLFPGAGGTQRVARLMQTGDALQLLFKGEQLKAAKAKAAELVHELAPEAEIVERARAWIVDGGKGKAPWDVEGFKPPSGRVFSPGGMMVWPAANAIYRRETFDNYPAAKAILHSVFEGLQLPFDLGLRVEARWFAHILRSQAGGGDDPLAVPLQERAGEGRASAQGPAASPSRCARDRSCASACARIALSLSLKAPGSGTRAVALLGDHRQRALRQIAEIVGEIGVDAVDDRLVIVAAVLAERDLAQEEVAHLIDAVLLGEIERIDDVADRFRHLLAAVEQEAVAEHPLLHGMPGRHQECRPVHRVKADDVLADDVHVGRPVAPVRIAARRESRRR